MKSNNYREFKITMSYVNSTVKKNYIKKFTHSYYASQHCKFRMDNNPKIESCVYESVEVKAKSSAPKRTLEAIPNKPNYFRDAEGYKYFIHNGTKIKSDKPLFAPRSL
jgi:hypothetical protein